jgi:hypothetical protein
MKTSARPHLEEILERDIEAVIQLPDDRAAEELDRRMGAWDLLDRLHERSYAERGLIAREFERRQLWKYLIDPEVGVPFASFTAWMSSGSIGGRRVNFEAKRDIEELSDLPAEKIVDVSKSNLKVLKQVSTQVRPILLDAARTLPTNELLAKIEKEHPNQHIESKMTIRFSLESSAAKEVERAISLAIERGARDRNEALEYLAADYQANVILEENFQ